MIVNGDGHNLRSDGEGYLVEPDDWDKRAAEQLAALEQVTLTDEHWQGQPPVQALPIRLRTAGLQDRRDEAATWLEYGVSEGHLLSHSLIQARCIFTPVNGETVNAVRE